MKRLLSKITTFFRLLFFGPTKEVYGLEFQTIYRMDLLSRQLDQILHRLTHKTVPVTVTIIAETSEGEYMCMGDTVSFTYVEGDPKKSRLISMSFQPQVNIKTGWFFITGPENIGVVEAKVGTIALVAAINTHIRAGIIPAVSIAQRLTITVGEYDDKT